MKNSRIVSWLLVSALTAGVGCGDDDKNTDKALDSGTDPVVVDDTDASEADAADEEADAAVEGTTDEADASVVVEEDAASAVADEDAATDAEVVQEPLEIVGRWASNYGFTDVFTSAAYGADTILEYDNTTNTMYTQTAADSLYGPNQFNKIVWTELASGQFYLCTIAYEQPTLADAKATTNVADSTALDSTGCGVSSWTRYGAVIEIEGSWAAGAVTIDSGKWTSTEYGLYVTTVAEYDNTTNVAYTKNAADDTYSPNTYNKVVWTEIADNSFYYCTIDFGLTTLSDAKASTKVADAATPDTTGCGSSYWSKLTRSPASN